MTFLLNLSNWDMRPTFLPTVVVMQNMLVLACVNQTTRIEQDNANAFGVRRDK